MILLCLIAVILAVTVLVVGCRYLADRLRYYKRSDRLADQRMKLLRRLLRLAYVYDHDPALFVKKFREEVSIGYLQRSDVICGHAELKQFDAIRTEAGQQLKDCDVLLYILRKKGFTPQELSVIYGLSNYNSIYVRCSRIRKRCRLPVPGE